MDKLGNPAIDTSSLPWPEGGLENVGACPVCGAKARTILHRDLADDVFRCAPGKWSLWRCSGCESAYLDPRPTPETIHIAYQSYYTHSAGKSRKEFEALGLVRRLRRRLSNGYANWRYDAKREPASILGVPLAYCFPPLKSVVDRAFRHLPRKAGGSLALLDVGCGNGEFLEVAAECGWKAVGVDPDPKAVAKAKELGLEVYQGGVEVFQGKQALFDFISLSHVIEHVHSPPELLKACFDLLRPGGLLWIETPNINSFGHKFYTTSWRGIETPRHLVLLNYRSLQTVLYSCGFGRVSRCPRPTECQSMFLKSNAIRNGMSPYSRLQPFPSLAVLALASSMIATLHPHKREFLAVKAYKSASVSR
jgi:2-polyprenyl-3-methyl-5-hydroxy-6-metoxy-1,4-benzoquinol methylase